MKFLLAAVAVATLSACTRIDTGNVGVEQTVGQVKLEELTPGLYFTLFKKVHEMTAKEMSMALNDMKPKTKDHLTMADFDVDVYYRINPGKVADLFVKYNGDVVEDKNGDGIAAHGRVFRSAREAAYKAASEYNALDMNRSRTDLANRVLHYMQAELNRVDPETFSVTDVNIRSLVTDPALEASIKANVETQNKIDQKQKEIELAKQEAERKRVEAEGEARANKIIAESLDSRLIELKRIEAQQAFAKSGTHTIVMQGGATPLIQVK
ncbi:SPFH domain-containing protein [Noviherbaspirillum sp.]|uniref:SPFH domain-containing protein n=1 Tax=Noviherbaspirillum sp. TaxID=1926288 RepID=UPI002FE2A1A6